MSSSRSGDPSSASQATPSVIELTPTSHGELGSETLQHRDHAAANDSVELRRLHHHPSEPRLDLPDDEDDEDSGSEDEKNARRSLQRLKRVNTMSKDYTDEEEATVVRKLDRKLVLFLAFLYMLSFLDRSNIGNARIAGLEEALSLSSAQYDWLLTAFYITYIAFEWMILLYRLVPAHIYISLCVLSWGLVASLQSITTGFSQLLVLRGLLGITEAAFGPGVPFYMTFFYKRSELAYRVGLQISAAPLATSFASSLAWVIIKLSQGGPIESWRALFLVEGFPSILTAVAAWYWIPDEPSKVRYLTQRERKVAVLRLQSERAAEGHHYHVQSPASSSNSSTNRGVDFGEILKTLLDPKSYLTALMFLSVNVSFSSLPVFLPTIINSMSFSPLASQALAAPPYLFAFIFVLFIGHYSDKIPNSRAWFLIAVSLLSSASYAAIALAGRLHESLGDAGSITIRYVSVFGAAMGLFSAVTLIITWTLNNQESSTGKGTGLTILNIVGQCGPLVGVHLFPKAQGPLYVPGMAVCAGFMGGVALLAAVLRCYLAVLNRIRNGKRTGGYEMVQMGAEGRGEEGDGEEGDAGEAQETLMGVGRKGGEEFRFML